MWPTLPSLQTHKGSSETDTEAAVVWLDGSLQTHKGSSETTRLMGRGKRIRRFKPTRVRLKRVVHRLNEPLSHASNPQGFV